MGQPVEITRLEHSASELRAFAAQIKDAAVARRLLALALVLEGHSRELAATMNPSVPMKMRHRAAWNLDLRARKDDLAHAHAADTD